MVGANGGPTGMICQQPLVKPTARQIPGKGDNSASFMVSHTCSISNKSYIIFWSTEASFITKNTPQNFYFFPKARFCGLGNRLHKLAGSWWPLPYLSSHLSKFSIFGPFQRFSLPEKIMSIHRYKLRDKDAKTQRVGFLERCKQ